ncbi:hypothetical protein V8G54_019722 [Vigna mungo]|uniref:Uncharacterized protein n=1 Tax=Vigna mungo TaxID=3915 RepID=A0AAQ3RW07_VIGMU
MEAPYEPFVDITECYLRWPYSVDGGLHGLSFKDKKNNLGLLGAEAEGEGVPSMVSQDGEVGRQECCGGRERKLVFWFVGVVGWWERKNLEKLQWSCPSDCEGFHYELPSKSDTLYL